MAREYARAVVTSTPSFDRLPRRLVSTAWKRSMENLARVRFDVEQSARESLMVDTQARFSVIYEFVKGRPYPKYLPRSNLQREQHAA
jgi:hypothetical protein